MSICMVMCRVFLETGVTIRWLDNFSKCYAVAVQSIDKGAFRDCAWTGDAFKVYVGPSVDTSLGQLPAMPDQVFSEDILDLVNASLGRASRLGWMLFNRSLVNRLNVNTIPLKPVIGPWSNQRLHRVLSECRDGLKNFHPSEIHPQNIGSNRGLFLILKRMASERKASRQKFDFLCVDCNIFLRVVRVGARSLSHELHFRNITKMVPLRRKHFIPLCLCAVPL